MKGWIRRIEAALAAAAFAEEGDAGTARQMVAEADQVETTAAPRPPRRNEAQPRRGGAPRAPLAKGSRA